MILVALVFGLTFLDSSRFGGGWFWDFGNALGFLGFAGLLFQMIPPIRARRDRQHEFLGYWVLGTVIVHAFWFLVGDGTVRFYLQPGTSLHVWIGLGALLLLGALAVLARMPDRVHIQPSFHSFLKIHRVLAFLTVGGALLHILLSGFYLSTWTQIALIGLLTITACFARSGWFRIGKGEARPSTAYPTLGLVAMAVFVLIRNLGA